MGVRFWYVYTEKNILKVVAYSDILSAKISFTQNYETKRSHKRTDMRTYIKTEIKKGFVFK